MLMLMLMLMMMMIVMIFVMMISPLHYDDHIALNCINDDESMPSLQ